MKLLIVISMLFFASCTGESAKVITADLLSNTLSTSIIKALDCQEEEVVKEDVKTEINKWFGLKQDKGIVQNLCKTAIAEVVPMLLGATMNVVRPTWKCTVVKIDNAAQMLSELACNNIKI